MDAIPLGSPDNKKPLMQRRMKGFIPVCQARSAYCPIRFDAGFKTVAKAGLLAFGSFYSPRLPISHQPETVVSQISSPITAAGPLPILTGFPVRPMTGTFT